jgi:hypothetical protein
MHGINLVCRTNHGYVRLVELVRKEFWPETAQNENASSLDCNDTSTEQLERTRINPVCIRELDDQRPRKRETENLSSKRSDGEISLPLWRQIWRGIKSVRGSALNRSFRVTR